MNASAESLKTLPAGISLQQGKYLMVSTHVNGEKIRKYIGIFNDENLEKAKAYLMEVQGPQYVLKPKQDYRRKQVPVVREAEKITERFKDTPRKNQIQKLQNGYAIQFLAGDADLVMDLPNLNVAKSFLDFEDFKGLMFAEKDPEIFRAIRAKIDLYPQGKRVVCIHPGDFFDMIQIVPRGHHVSLVNYDGMGHATGSFSAGAARLLASPELGKKCVFRVTFSNRGCSHKQTRIILARVVNAAKGWNIHQDMEFPYHETALHGMPMLTTQFFMERK